MNTELCLRERKKQQTRRAIAQAAKGLFLERGFDRVSVAEVARAADVSEQTVFNYFPTKEDLVFERMDTFEHELLAAVRNRPEGEPALRAFVRFIVNRSNTVMAGDGKRRVAELTRLVTASPSLMSRERQIVARPEWRNSLRAGRTRRDRPQHGNGLQHRPECSPRREALFRACPPKTTTPSTAR